MKLANAYKLWLIEPVPLTGRGVRGGYSSLKFYGRNSKIVFSSLRALDFGSVFSFCPKGNIDIEFGFKSFTIL